MYTKKDLAKMFNCHIRTIDRWVMKKKIPYIKSEFNGRIYFDEEEIKRWAKKNYIGNID